MAVEMKEKEVSRLSRAWAASYGMLPWPVSSTIRFAPPGRKRMTTKKRDLYGFGDTFAFDDEELWIIQGTTKTNVAARKKKIEGIKAAKRWLLGGFGDRRIFVVGFEREEKGAKASRVVWEYVLERKATRKQDARFGWKLRGRAGDD